ncbi:MAG: SAM-dependent DNA methyltransferase, partial [Candidatus Electrothrix sp. ATG1]|nr:SAM-dependent DNA methyltransferase [Candidatus Electrothrix sp. ATG1]
FVALQADFADSEKSWSVQVDDLDQESLDLSVRNPNAEEETPLREPVDILAEIAALDRESAEVLERVGGLV